MQINRKAAKLALLSAIARLFGVALGAGAGSLIYNLVGGKLVGWPIAMTMAILSFFLLLFVEYERELNK
jgi:hypothetical protein